MKTWEEKWRISEIFIEGDDEAMEALNYSLYHLHSIAPRHTRSLSIAARGLSGQTYKGAVFWDTEMFMLDFFLFTEPEVAKTLLRYRIDTLAGAKEKAKYYGYEGAFYAWESQEGGFDACSDYNVTDVFTGRPMRTYFKDKQIHISAAIAYGIMRYVEYTGNDDLLKEGGGEVIIECARFYYSLLVKRINKEYYELWDVIGPDEYHERVNNNAYTNRMAKFTFEAAIKITIRKFYIRIGLIMNRERNMVLL
jgi:kojibiose phosphorylase/nigerose phosphorylase